MYIPEHFRQADPDALEALIRANGFGVLVSLHDGRPMASHVPLLYDRRVGAHGRLSGHVARANPQWRSLADGQTVLAIFQGPHAYVSPTWYATPGVPTWNYTAVHAYGRARLVEEAGPLSEILDRLTAFYEAGRAAAPASAVSPETRARLLQAIVGFEIEITEIQGKFKLSQNRPEEDRRRVIEQFRQAASEDAAALARLMAAALAPEG